MSQSNRSNVLISQSEPSKHQFGNRPWSFRIFLVSFKVFEYGSILIEHISHILSILILDFFKVFNRDLRTVWSYWTAWTNWFWSMDPWSSKDFSRQDSSILLYAVFQQMFAIQKNRLFELLFYLASPNVHLQLECHINR